MKDFLRFLLKWVVIFFSASVLIFAVVHMMPVTPEQQYLESMALPQTEENLAMARRMMGLDRPLTVQYLSWIGGFLRGDWGTTMISKQNIRAEFLKRMPYSFSIGLLGTALACLGAYFLGYRAAIHKGGAADRFSSFLSILSQALPEFIVAMLLIYVLSVRLHVAKMFTGNGVMAMICAILITAFAAMGSLTRVVRTAFREEMGKSYVNFSVSRGFPKEKYILLHAGRPVLCRLLGTITARFASIFGGSSILEFAFAIPGVSYFLISNMQDREYTVMQSYVLVVVLWMFVVQLVIQVLIRILDVRTRRQA